VTLRCLEVGGNCGGSLLTTVYPSVPLIRFLVVHLLLFSPKRECKQRARNELLSAPRCEKFSDRCFPVHSLFVTLVDTRSGSWDILKRGESFRDSIWTPIVDIEDL